MKKRFLAALCVATVFLPLASTISSAGTIKWAVDDDVRYIASTVSSVVHALNDAIAKHNERDPDKTVPLLNFNSLDPALTLSWFSRQ